MTIDPEDETVAAAFANLKAESAAHFPPPPVNELIMRGPAALRRRRLVSLAAVVGACTAVTAGGFAVAQTLGPLAGGPDATTSSAAASDSADEGDDGTTRVGEPASPHVDESGDETDTVLPEGESVLMIDANPEWEAAEGEWSESCGTGPQPVDFSTWTIGEDSAWVLLKVVADEDLDGDGDADDVVAELSCADAQTGVAAFTWDETGTSLLMTGWVWEPQGPGDSVGIESVREGVITLAGTKGEAAEPWATGYRWNAETEAFAPLEEDATVDPTPDETTSSPEPAESPTDAATTPSASSGS